MLLNRATFDCGQMHAVEGAAALNTCAEETRSVSEGRSQSDSERSELPARARETNEERSLGVKKNSVHPYLCCLRVQRKQFPLPAPCRFDGAWRDVV